jgi:hypothetical protein
MFNWSFLALSQELGLASSKMASVGRGWGNCYFRPPGLAFNNCKKVCDPNLTYRPACYLWLKEFPLDLCPCSEIAVRTLMAQLDLTLNVRDTVPSISSAR